MAQYISTEIREALQELICKEIIHERMCQDCRFSQLRHSEIGWENLIAEYALAESVRTYDVPFRERMIKVAALAMAAAEDVDLDRILGEDYSAGGKAKENREARKFIYFDDVEDFGDDEDDENDKACEDCEDCEACEDCSDCIYYDECDCEDFDNCEFGCMQDEDEDDQDDDDQDEEDEDEEDEDEDEEVYNMRDRLKRALFINALEICSLQTYLNTVQRRLKTGNKDEVQSALTGTIDLAAQYFEEVSEALVELENENE